jgi:Fe-S cluster assembly protein SufD
MSIIVEKLDNQGITLTADRENLTYIILADQPGEKEVTVELAKEGIEVELLGIFIGRQGEMKVRTTQHHVKPHGTSNLLFKTVLLDEAKFDYRGLIKIDPNAQGSNAYQRNDNLVLHDKAQVETQPELEIEANEVRCTHGATVGKLDEEQLYYLMTRGLALEQAEQILLTGFLGEVVDKIDDLQVRDKVLEFVRTNLKS